ncbi:hypothetical protein MNBD_GAMMA11-505 [hydrothermal vent metagenome]|uniref:Uncharacterized protein n=1 Tax=hydrothermal vent metagenome TaxID=652676 RepID=A0A3B0WX21_9ZZZZ
MLIALCTDMVANADTSTRIEVYAISQHFRDVLPGETLGDIVKQLLPNSPAMHKSLLNEIVQLNPDAFGSNNPDKLKANIRLWLPGSTPLRHKIPDENQYDTRSFSWGKVHRLRR